MTSIYLWNVALEVAKACWYHAVRVACNCFASNTILNTTEPARSSEHFPPSWNSLLEWVAQDLVELVAVLLVKLAVGLAVAIEGSWVGDGDGGLAASKQRIRIATGIS